MCSTGLQSPYLLVDVPSDDDVLRILSRTVLVKMCIRSWGVAQSWPELVDHLLADPHEGHVGPGAAWKSLTFETAPSKRGCHF